MLHPHIFVARTKWLIRYLEETENLWKWKSLYQDKNQEKAEEIRGEIMRLRNKLWWKDSEWEVAVKASIEIRNILAERTTS